MQNTGVLTRVEMGGFPVYRFDTVTGGLYQIRGEVPPDLVGVPVKVAAKPSEMAMSVGMVGTILDLISIERA